MSYSNRFYLKILLPALRVVEHKYCSKCNISNLSGKYCSECGAVLEIRTTTEEIDIIPKFRIESKDGWLLTDTGRSNEVGSGTYLLPDLIKFSTKYPEAVFELKCRWDEGFGDLPTFYYIKNGLVQKTDSAKRMSDINKSDIISNNLIVLNDKCKLIYLSSDIVPETVLFCYMCSTTAERGKYCSECGLPLTEYKKEFYLGTGT